VAAVAHFFSVREEVDTHMIGHVILLCSIHQKLLVVLPHHRHVPHQQCNCTTMFAALQEPGSGLDIPQQMRQRSAGFW
jgi:hypothetical protein